MGTLLPQRGYNAAIVIFPLYLRGSRRRGGLPLRRSCSSPRVALEPLDSPLESGDFICERSATRLERRELGVDSEPLEACVYGGGLPALRLVLCTVARDKDVPRYLA